MCLLVTHLLEFGFVPRLHLSLSSLGSWLLLEAYRLLTLQSMLTQGFERLYLLYYMRMYINQNVSICSYFPFCICYFHCACGLADIILSDFDAERNFYYHCGDNVIAVMF